MQCIKIGDIETHKGKVCILAQNYDLSYHKPTQKYKAYIVMATDVKKSPLAK
jgi:hypothetical protein